MNKIKKVETKDDRDKNIKVIIRTRPTPSFAMKNINLDTNDNIITVHLPKTEDKGLINSQKESWTFKYDKILHNISQDELFEYSAKEIICKSIEGMNGTVFCYGQTGSGKTFTMSGTPNNYSYRGIVPRAVTRVFQEMGNKPELDFQVKVSYLEIYNETFFDLLSQSTSLQMSKTDISLQEDSKGQLIIKGLSMIGVNNEEEAFNLLFEGEANRTIAFHKLNKDSSRSHCLFTIYLEMKSKIESSEKVKTAKLNFVDLAVSERVKKTGSTGITLKEANYINKSLTFLEQVVISLVDKSKYKKGKFSNDHIPYRQSKLTHILKDSIGGNCNTVMITTIIPEEAHLQETLSSLNFARRMMFVENEVSVNIQLDIHKQLKIYAKEIKELKQELAMHNTLSNRGRVNYEPYTPEEQYIQQEIAMKFLTGKNEDISFESVRQAKELFNQCRILYQKIYDPIKDNQYQSQLDDPRAQNKKQSVINQTDKVNYEEGSGELEVKPSFGIGRAPKEARPINKLEVSHHLNSDEDEKVNMTGVSMNRNREDDVQDNYISNTNNMMSSHEDIPDKSIAFGIFKQESKIGKELEQLIQLQTNELKKKKEEGKVLLDECNELKDRINDLRLKLENKKNYKFNLGDEMTNIIDEEEYNYYNKLKSNKDDYKERLRLFKDVKSDINVLKGNIDMYKVSYLENFESWFYKKYGLRIEDYELKVNKGKFGFKHEIEEVNEKIIDIEEMAYFNAKKKVASISRARRLEKIKK